ncbi:restriction endonuclease [Pantoea phage AH01]|nr:restriction endonuclease [Pantoea phage AH01]
MAKTPEGDIVEYAKKQLKERGCLVRKISYEMRRGCPDMLVLVPARVDRWLLDPKVIFIEFKKDENTEPEPHQLREHERMQAVGADVRVIGTRQQVDDLVKELFPCE